MNSRAMVRCIHFPSLFHVSCGSDDMRAQTHTHTHTQTLPDPLDLFCALSRVLSLCPCPVSRVSRPPGWVLRPGQVVELPMLSGPCPCKTPTLCHATPCHAFPCSLLAVHAIPHKPWIPRVHRFPFAPSSCPLRSHPITNSVCQTFHRGPPNSRKDISQHGATSCPST